MKLWKILLATMIALVLVCAVAMADETETPAPHVHKYDDILQVVKTSDLMKNSNGTHSYLAMVTRGCITCGEVYGTKEETLTDPCDYKEGVFYNATCEKPGYRLDVCACGNSDPYEYSVTYPALGHKYELKKVGNGDCQTQTTWAYKCANCGEYEHGRTFPGVNAQGKPIMGDHKYSWSTTGNAADCTDVTFKQGTCTVPGCKETDEGHFVWKEEAGRENHIWDLDNATIVAPTCDDDGYTIAKCQYCDVVSSKFNIKPALDHNSKTYHAEVKATCQQDGVKAHYTCNYCGAILDGVTDKVYTLAEITTPMNSNAHEVVNGGWKYTYKSCTSDKNYRTAKCMICDADLFEYLPAGSHQYIDPAKLSGYIQGHIIKDSTGEYLGRVDTRSYCDKTGTATLWCSVCHNQNANVTIPMTPHKLSDWDFPNGLGDCLNPMISVRVCKNTGCTYKETKVLEEATGHNWKVIEGTNTATCDKAGVVSQKCENCGFVQSNVAVGALGHDYTEKVTPATCEKDGKVVKTCKVCGDKKTEKIPAAHGATKEVAGKAPACGVAGTIDVVCTVCGAKVGEKSVAALSHEYSWIVVTKPSAAGNGRNEYKCNLCGDVAEVKTIKYSKYYYNNTMTSFGPMTRELVGGNDWYRVTPVDVTVDGVYTYDLIASNKYVVGTVTISVNAGTLTVSYKVKGNVDVKDESLLIYASKADLAAGSAVTAPVGAAINVAETFGADGKVLVSLILTGDYDAAGKDLVNDAAAAGMIANID